METKKHIFSAGGVVVHDGQVLLIEWLSRRTFDFPKGKIDEAESAQQAAVREVKEETGYDTRIIDELGDVTFEFNWSDGKRYLKTVTYYLMELANNDAPVTNLQPGEDFENYWVKLDQAETVLTYSEAKDVLQRALNSPKLPI